MAKKEKKEEISIFGAAATAKPKAAPTDKEVVNIKGLETKLLEMEFIKAQIADLTSHLGGIKSEIKEVAKARFIELYKTKKENPNTFYIKDGEGCVMVIPMDKYASINSDRANELMDAYGKEAVLVKEKYYFNNLVLERNMKAIEKAIVGAKDITDDDKKNLVVKDVSFAVAKGFIDKLYPFGEKLEEVMDNIQPEIQLKECGKQAAAEGGVMEEGGHIASIYEETMADGGEFIGSIYAGGGLADGKEFPTKYTVKNIKWDRGSFRGSKLPETIEITIPDDVDKDYDSVDLYISDEISNISGYMHRGFDTVPEIPQEYAKGGILAIENEGISLAEMEKMAGRKLGGWGDGIVNIDGHTYKKCFMKPLYKKC